MAALRAARCVLVNALKAIGTDPGPLPPAPEVSRTKVDGVALPGEMSAVAADQATPAQPAPASSVKLCGVDGRKPLAEVPIAGSETLGDDSERVQASEKLAVTVSGALIVTVVEALPAFATFPLQLAKVYPALAAAPTDTIAPEL